MKKKKRRDSIDFDCYSNASELIRALEDKASVLGVSLDNLFLQQDSYSDNSTCFQLETIETDAEELERETADAIVNKARADKQHEFDLITYERLKKKFGDQ